MRPFKLKESPRLAYLLSALPFVFSALDGFTTGALMLGGMNLIGVVSNLLAFRFYERLPAAASAYFSILNAAIAFVLSYHYFELGKSGLPYAWIIVGIVNLFAAYILYRKRAVAS